MHKVEISWRWRCTRPWSFEVTWTLGWISQTQRENSFNEVAVWRQKWSWV